MAILTLQMKILLQTSALAYELWCGLNFEASGHWLHHMKWMQKSVVYYKWPNVDIYCKRADA